MLWACVSGKLRPYFAGQRDSGREVLREIRALRRGMIAEIPLEIRFAGRHVARPVLARRRPFEHCFGEAAAGQDVSEMLRNHVGLVLCRQGVIDVRDDFVGDHRRG